MSSIRETISAQLETLEQHSISAQTKSTLMHRQNIANSKNCYVTEVSLIELKLFVQIRDIPHYYLLNCQINERHFYNIAFLELQIQTAIWSVLL